MEIFLRNTSYPKGNIRIGYINYFKTGKATRPWLFCLRAECKILSRLLQSFFIVIKINLKIRIKNKGNSINHCILFSLHFTLSYYQVISLLIPLYFFNIATVVITIKNNNNNDKYFVLLLLSERRRQSSTLSIVRLV